MGALAFTLIGLGENQNGKNEKSEFNLIEFLLDNYIYMCLVMVTIGVLYLIGGLNIRKYKLCEYSEESTPPVPGESTPVIDSYFAHFVPLVFQS